MAALKKYADFSGRSRRSEYWFFALFSTIIYILLAVVDAMIGTMTMGIGLLSMVYLLAMLIPYIAVTIRRLHDTGRTGWMFLVSFIPFIGSIILLVFCVQDSQQGPNKWGPNPKGLAQPAM